MLRQDKPIRPTAIDPRAAVSLSDSGHPVHEFRDALDIRIGHGGAGGQAQALGGGFFSVKVLE